MKKLASILLIFCGLSMTGQVLHNNSMYYTDSVNEMIHFQGSGYYGSTNLPLEFSKILYRGGTISSNMKDLALTRTRALNRLGGEAIGNLAYYNFKPVIFNQFGYYINASTQHSMGFEFTDDLFKSVFYGNQSFKNDTIQLMQTSLHSRLYNSFQVGLIKNKLHFGVSYISIQSEINALIQEGGIYTSTNGTYLDTYINGLLIETKDLPGYFQQNGWGIGFNFKFSNRLNLSDSNSNARIIAGLNGFGVQFLNKNSSVVIIDTAFVYQGIQVQSLSDLSQSLLPQQFADSLLPSDVYQRRFGALPFELYIHKTGGKSNAKIHSIYGLRYRSQSNYSTLIYLGAEYHLNQQFTTGAILSYGGYTKYQLGSHLRYKNPHFILGINTNNLLGWFWKKGNGIGLNCSISYLL